ncbi:type II toxin-antitoxin system HicB family antitoxin [Nostoc sp. XA013]|nr:type II toxin-antitoxin system HicB family antitoxin [Nostoc sp. XA013]
MYTVAIQKLNYSIPASNTTLPLLTKAIDYFFIWKSLVAILHWEKDVYVAQCPEVGTASQGETIEKAIANLQEATKI